MRFFQIDTDKYDKDGICAIECPAHIIEMTEQGPAPAPGAEEICNRCGHCVAVCPKGAFGLGSCWAGYVTYAAAQWPGLAAVLNLPNNHTCHGALMVGYPKFRYFRAPQRNAPDITYHV